MTTTPLRPSLQKQYDGLINRQGLHSKLAKRLKQRLAAQERVDHVCQQLSTLVNMVSPGKAIHISLNDGVHELYINGESLGGMISLHTIDGKLPVFTDNLPDYILNAQVAAMSYRYDKPFWTEPTIEMARAILQYGGAMEIYIPTSVVPIDSSLSMVDTPPMGNGEIPMSEVLGYLNRDARPNAGPIKYL